MSGKRVSRLYSVLSALFLASKSSAQVLQVFGDSLSDAGINAPGGGFAKWVQKTLQTSEVFPQPPYYQGVFSNGPVWVTQAASLLRIKYYDYAAGGAAVGVGISQLGPLPPGFAGYPNNVTVLAPNLYQQIDQFFEANNNTANSSDVFVIFLGNNDYFSIASTDKNITAEEVVSNIDNGMEVLYHAGARKFITVTIPPISALPAEYTSNPALVEAWNEHNDLLKAQASMFTKSQAGSSVQVFDFEFLLLQTVLNAGQYGFSGNLTGCYLVPNAGFGYESGVPVCSDPSSHLIWDTVHPTAASHALVGRAFAQQFGYIWGESLGPAPSASASSTG